MSLQLIYGRSGTGKSKYCFDNISEQINNNEKIYIITPEQFSFTAEKELLKAIKNNSVINAEVLSFERMAYRIFNEVGGLTLTNLSKCGRTMLVYDILANKQKNLKFLNSADKNLETALNAITELKKHNINKELLEKTIQEISDDYLKIKLQDLNYIYNEFENRIENNYIDENDTLTLLAQKLEKSNMFKNKIIYIDEFVGFTEQEYNIIRKLLKIAKKVYITICEESSGVINNPCIKTAEKLMKYAKLDNIKVEPHIVLENTYRFKNKELKHIEENINKLPYKKYSEKTENIQLFLAQNPYSEIEYVAQNILRLVKNKNYNYRDIAIITKNIDTYSNIAKAIFEKYEIPVFIDEKKELSRNILAKYILSIIEIFSKNWSYEAMFNYIKTGFLDIDMQDIFKLENYVIKWGIKGTKWYNKEWEYNDDLTKDMNQLRKLIVQPLLEFKENLAGTKTAKEITQELYKFIENNKVQEKINNKIKQLEEINEHEIAEELQVSLKTIIDILDEIVLIFGDSKITFENYKNILKVGMQNVGLGKIPTTLDQVIMGDVDRTKSHNIKAVFIIGLNDGVLPSVNTSEGFLNDSDREYLKSKNIELAATTKEKLYEEQFNIYKIFSMAEEKIFLTYPIADKDGKSLRPSIIITKFKKIFINLSIYSDIIDKQNITLLPSATFDDLLINIKKYIDGEQIDKIWFDIYNWYNNNNEWKEKLNNALLGIQYNNNPQTINKKNIEKLYGNMLKTSVSKLEQYRKCPFSFHLKYGLNLKEQQEFKIKPIDTGSFMHEVIEQFFEIVKEKDIKTISDSEVEQVVNNIVEEQLNLKKNYIFTSTKKFVILTNRLKKVVLQSILYIVEQLKNSSFSVLGTEVEFKENGKYKPIVLQLENGQKVEITGKIDRIDIGKTKDNTFVRIIDYKSSVKNVELNQVVSGLQIQLLTYLDSITTIEDVLPAGILYFNLLDPIIKNNKNISDEQIKQEIRKKFKMDGLILADINVVKMMDNTLDKGYSNIIPAYIGVDGSLNENRSNAIKLEDFENLQKYVHKIIKQISKEILNGNIEIKPFYMKNKNTACDFCEYKPICRFNKNNNEYMFINDKDNKEILEEIKVINKEKL